jgi:hypothetical protein
MIKYITAALMLLTIATSQAQNNRADTTILGIYNTGTRFTVTRADFGTQTPTELIFEMVLAFDTVKVITSVADTTRGGRKEKHSYTHRCNYLSGLQGNADLFKDKIVLMELNKDCDVTEVCLLAQRAGAKGFMFIHNSNSNGNIHLPKKGAFECVTQTGQGEKNREFKRKIKFRLRNKIFELKNSRCKIRIKSD